MGQYGVLVLPVTPSYVLTSTSSSNSNKGIIRYASRTHGPTIVQSPAKVIFQATNHGQVKPIHIANGIWMASGGLTQQLTRMLDYRVKVALAG